jgi:uncharacterized protein (DUF1330 family)
MIIAEFPSMERVRQWYDSPEYAAALTVGCSSLTAPARDAGSVMFGRWK